MKIRMLEDADYRFSGTSSGYAVKAYKADREYVVTRAVGEALVARKVAELVQKAQKQET